MLNTNEKFLEMTFEALGKYQKKKQKQKMKFGCSIFVFPQRNYIFKSLSNMQPLKVQQAIREVHNFNLEFLPIEDNVISLELNDITRDLFVKNDSHVYKLLAGYLYKINFIFGKINDYVYRGNLSQKVVEQFVRSVWESEVAESNIDNDFNLIREWANREFVLPEKDADDAKELEKQYRMDGKSVKVDKKVTDSFLIDLPRDDKGRIIRVELEKILSQQKKNRRKNKPQAKRKTFLNLSTQFDIRSFSKVFMDSLTNSKNNSSKNSVSSSKKNFKLSKKAIDKLRVQQSQKMKNKYKPDFEIKEESLNYSKNKSKSSSRKERGHTHKSYDSHSDSEDFDPNASMLSDQSDKEFNKEEVMYYQDFDLMVVLDRSNDLVTPFIPQSSYLGIIDDLLKSKYSFSL